VPFWLGPISSFGHALLTRVQTTVHVCYPCGTSLASGSTVLLAEFACALAGHSRRLETGDVVGQASHGVVTHAACRPRLLLVAQQVVANDLRLSHDKATQDLLTSSVSLLSGEPKEIAR